MHPEIEVALRLVVGTAAGMIIGIDRGRAGHGTGARTLGLVGLGSAAATAIFMDRGSDELSRVVQGLVTGIGFVGAGVIVRPSGEEVPRGLTTATSVWVTAALGAAAGAGAWLVAAAGVVIAFVLLAGGNRLERLVGARRARHKRGGGASPAR